MASVLVSAVAALGLLARAAIDGWPAFARTICESVSAGTCPPTVYRSAAYELGLAVAAFVGVVVMTLLTWRYVRSLRRASVRTRAHAEAARITGRRVEGQEAPFVLDASQPAVYCVPGRPATIVVTTGALAVLGTEQLTAVLAHERAHLAGRHHLLLAVTRSLAAIAPFVPLFARGTGEVARLAEMRADDVAARHGSRRTLLTALLAMSAGGRGVGTALAGTALAGTALAGTALAGTALAGTALAAPAGWLPATGGIVADRVRRLAEPPAPARWACYGLALTAIMLASVLMPALAVTGI
jgi:Zn-dependent protease with chaperone function